MKAAFWSRRTHKWIGLVIGVQALLWMISGVYMTVISLDLIHGDHLVHPVSAALEPEKDRLPPDRLLALYPGATSFRLKQLLGQEVFEVKQGGETALVDAYSGKQISPLEKDAVLTLAKSIYQGEAKVSKVEWVMQAPQEIATRAALIPVWAVHFADQGETTLYFSPSTGELLARRHSLWRWFDFVWMLHIMDYDQRTDVNNNLLRAAAGTGLAFALSGMWLLFYSFRRRSA